jgi:NAD(P)-dependent dehydrogenase (short-subunit alcohol dehydrogenase family)
VAVTIDINLTGAWNTVSPAIPHLVAGGRGGSIVLISSTAGLKGNVHGSAGAIAYTASKHGIVASCGRLRWSSRRTRYE